MTFDINSSCERLLGPCECLPFEFKCLRTIFMKRIRKQHFQTKPFADFNVLSLNLPNRRNLRIWYDDNVTLKNTVTVQ